MGILDVVKKKQIFFYFSVPTKSICFFLNYAERKWESIEGLGVGRIPITNLNKQKKNCGELKKAMH